MHKSWLQTLTFIIKDSPGIQKLECDDQQRFMYFFIAFGSCIKGFEFMRRFTVANGVHLSGMFRGVMLVDGCQYGNGGIFPIAFGVVYKKNDALRE